MTEINEAWAVILAAGRSTRLRQAGEGCAKQFLHWKGEPLYMASARTFAACAAVCGVVFVFPADQLEAEQERLKSVGGSLGLPWRCVSGGVRRQDSVRQALTALPLSCARVLIHDAARPFVSAALAVRVLAALEEGEGHGVAGVIPGLAVTDTIKIVEPYAGVEASLVQHRVGSTPARESLRAVQTPQGFHVSVLRAAHEQAEAENWDVTDDAALLEHLGRTVMVVKGERGNYKITNPEDMDMLQDTSTHMRVGYGYDVHRYVAADAPNARPLTLGGVAIDCGRTPMAVQAHSDGDVLLHALMDAVLGCFGGGDIGALFPDSDAAFANASSAVLLDEVLTLALQSGFTPCSVDMTIIAQKPKICPQRDAIRANVARLMGLPRQCVNVKATTEEGLGFTGALEGLKAVAVVTGSWRPLA